MILGIGTDLVEIARIEQALERWGERFARKVLVPRELARFAGHRKPAASTDRKSTRLNSSH